MNKPYNIYSLWSWSIYIHTYINDTWSIPPSNIFSFFFSFFTDLVNTAVNHFFSFFLQTWSIPPSISQRPSISEMMAKPPERDMHVLDGTLHARSMWIWWVSDSAHGMRNCSKKKRKKGPRHEKLLKRRKIRQKKGPRHEKLLTKGTGF